MCGLVGIWTNNNLEETQSSKLDKALQLIQHRGPNHQAIYKINNVGLGHCRLSIIDIDSQSNQPFHSNDGKYTLVFNGEIYNYKILRTQLKEKGFTFRTASDTEVLLNLLINYGKEGIALLDGFFAFAFYDHEKQDLLLARDRFGIKPLLYYEDDSQFIFGSELKAIQALSGELEVDLQALNYLFSLTYIPAPNTILKGIHKLSPGHCITVSHEGVEVSAYYAPKLAVNNNSVATIKNNLRTILTNSVKNRLVADVPLGCFLSGGVDSSIIAAIAKRLNPSLKTFSIGFDHPFFNEAKYAAQVAKHIGSDHKEYMLTKSDFKENFDDFLNALDEPFADSSAFAVFMLSKKVKQEVTVALSGDGADEIFGGYRKHFADYKLRRMGMLKKHGLRLTAGLFRQGKTNRSDKWGDLNRKVQKMAKGAAYTNAGRYWKWCQFIDDDSRKQLLGNRFTTLTSPIKLDNWNDLSSIFLADQELVLPNDMLKKVDQMSMAHGLEVRTPFLDHKVVEFANTLPDQLKVNNKGGKQILKLAFTDYLPENIFDRAKKGFEIPIFEWLNDEIELIIESELFSEEYIEKQGLFNFKAIDDLKNTWHKANAADQIYVVWTLIIFQHWWQRNKER